MLLLKGEPMFIHIRCALGVGELCAITFNAKRCVKIAKQFPNALRGNFENSTTIYPTEWQMYTENLFISLFGIHALYFSCEWTATAAPRSKCCIMDALGSGGGGWTRSVYLTVRFSCEIGCYPLWQTIGYANAWMRLSSSPRGELVYLTLLKHSRCSVGWEKNSRFHCRSFPHRIC